MAEAVVSLVTKRPPDAEVKDALIYILRDLLARAEADQLTGLVYVARWSTGNFASGSVAASRYEAIAQMEIAKFRYLNEDN